MEDRLVLLETFSVEVDFTRLPVLAATSIQRKQQIDQKLVTNDT